MAYLFVKLCVGFEGKIEPKLNFNLPQREQSINRATGPGPSAAKLQPQWA
jgi:hypothetical protein